MRHSPAARGKTCQRHAQKPRVRIMQRAPARRKQPVKPGHHRHRAEEAEHIAHRAKPLDQTNQSKRRNIPLFLPLRRLEPERYAPAQFPSLNDACRLPPP